MIFQDCLKFHSLVKLRITISKYRSLYFMPNITANHAITYTNLRENLNAWGGERLLSGSGVGLVGVREFVG